MTPEVRARRLLVWDGGDSLEGWATEMVDNEMLARDTARIAAAIREAVAAAYEDAAQIADKWEALGLTCVPAYQYDEWPDADKIAAAIRQRAGASPGGPGSQARPETP